MLRWDRYVLRPRVRVETSESETVPHTGPYICQILLMVLLLPLRLQVHLVLLLKNRLLLLPDSRVLKFLLPKHLLEKFMILLALRRNSLRTIMLYLIMIYVGSLMNVLI